MIPNHSPWIKQLNRTRPVVPLNTDIRADIVIVGGGIAGISTAFFTLRNTDKTVALLEADKIAHGATGHNAGQITSYFERPLSDLVDEFGFEKAIEGQRSVENGWALLDTMVTEGKLQTPVYRFTGYAGLSTFEQIINALKNSLCRMEGGLPERMIVVAEDWAERAQIPEEYKELYTVAPHSDVLGLLEADNAEFVACISSQKGCINSALLCEEMVGYLMSTYPERFSMYEGSPVKTVRLAADTAALEVLGHTVTTTRTVLCTNGFENFSIENISGSDIDTAFHHSVAGRIGYMSGYLEPLKHPPAAISYYLRTTAPSKDPAGENYFYLTRRPYEHEDKEPHNLVCAGGPDKVLPNGADYSREDSCSEEMRELIDDFLRKNYNIYPSTETEYAFCWHGLMGYTPNRVRRIGPDPCNPVLLYNLGCNGVGILPSIVGGQRISQFLKGEQLPPSIFDVGDSRCAI